MNTQKDSKVYLAKAKSYDEAESVVDSVIASFGGLQKYFIAGESVYIKANLLNKSSPENAVTTHPSLITALCRRLVDFGLKVVVGDSPAGAYTREKLAPIYEATGMTKACLESGATLNDDFSSEVQDIGGAVLKRLDITSCLLKCDKVINFAKFKTHSFTGYTGCVKNLFGAVPGRIKIQMHAVYKRLDNFVDMLIDLERYLDSHIVLHFMDGIIGMEGPGPSAGTPKQLGFVGCSESAYAMDTVALKIAGASKESMPLIIRARERNIALEEYEIVGASLAEFDGIQFTNIPVKLHEPISRRIPRLLRPLAYRLLNYKVDLKSKRLCMGCRKCEEHCPVGAVKVVGGKAKFNQDECIRCYCCQELCPFKAIKVSKPLFSRYVLK